MSKVKKHCLFLLKQSRCKILPFHCVEHTLEVYENVQTIGEYEKCNIEELEVLKIAALFHDTGVSEAYKGHEDISANNAQKFLIDFNYSKTKIERVMDIIRATKMPQSPKTKLERIICDADLFHLSSNNYLVKSELLRKEWKEYMGLIFSNEEWYQLNFKFLSEHHYHTDYGKKVLKEKKMKNIMLMEKLKLEATV